MTDWIDPIPLRPRHHNTRHAILEIAKTIAAFILLCSFWAVVLYVFIQQLGA